MMFEHLHKHLLQFHMHETLAHTQTNTHMDAVYTYFWVNYNDLTATSLGMMVSKGDYP